MKSLSELGDMFSKLDDMRDILEETLEGWKPPKVVVIGSESSGKSSVLERLMMCPLLPRDEALCTRVPIHVHLRRSGQSELPRLEVYDEERKRVLRSQDVVPMRGYQDVSDEMGKILKEVGEEGVTSKRTIRLHIKNPNVPCLDLIDMPGLVTTANSVRNVPAKTRQIITVCVPLLRFFFPRSMLERALACVRVCVSMAHVCMCVCVYVCSLCIRVCVYACMCVCMAH